MQNKNKIKLCKNIQERVIPTDAKQTKGGLNRSNIMNLGGWGTTLYKHNYDYSFTLVSYKIYGGALSKQQNKCSIFQGVTSKAKNNNNY